MPIAAPEWPSPAAGEAFSPHKKQPDADSARHLNKDSGIWCKNSSGKWVEGVLHLGPESGPIVCNINNELLEVEPERVHPANPEVLEGVSDLIQLSYLNEPSVLHNLEFRYDSDMIYTRAGPLLVAINPFKNVPLCTSSFVEKYREMVLGSPGPHIYDVAGSAYKSLIQDGASQSLIISGESGAGKTETAKIAMQYLAVLGGGRGLEREMLQTNPLLEAFGNAKTLRNNNSSRFYCREN